MSRRLARTVVLTLILVTLGVFASAPTALAYGNTAQWQVGFSGTCSSNAPASNFCPGGVHTGFWGWCEFGGSNGSSDVGTTGTSADCQITNYFGSGTSLHINYNVTGWVIQASSPFTFPPGLPDFLLTSGTLTLSGPGVVNAPFPPHVPIPFPFGPPINGCPAFICDTGIPPIPGHFSFHPTPGAEFNLQVTRLP
jgi:hypothetical protein